MFDFMKRSTDQGTLVIQTTGKLDYETNQYFFDCLRDEIEDGNTKIVVNFSDLGHVSSITLGSLIHASSKATKAGGTIYLACIDNKILDVFRVMKFDQLFNIFESEAEAITAIESQFCSEDSL